MLKKFAALLLSVLLLSPAPVRAEEVFELTPDVYTSANAEDASFSDANLTTDQPYVCLTYSAPEESPLSLTIRDGSGRMVYARDYGMVSGDFRSEDIYLALDGDSTVYRAVFQCGDTSWSFPIIRKIARLRDNAACSAGYPLQSISGKSTWETATFLDMSTSGMTCDLHASNRCNLGDVTFDIQGSSVTVSVLTEATANVSIERATVYIARTASEAQTLGSRKSTAISGALGSPVDVGDASVVAVYVALTVSYDPVGLDNCGAGELDGQDHLWQQMQEGTAVESVG